MNRTERIMRCLAASLAADEPPTPWVTRLVAAMLVLERFGIRLEVRPARTAIMSRFAAYRLGGTYLPTHAGEVAQFVEQAGHGIRLFGIGADAPRAVIVAGRIMLDACDSRDWNDRGVLVRPVCASIDPRRSEWTIEGLRYGTSIAYERTDHASIASEPTDEAVLLAGRLAREIERALRPSAQSG